MLIEFEVGDFCWIGDDSGWFAEDIEELTSSKTVTSAGGGIRWQVLKEKKLHLGLDVAFSTNGPAVYIHIGEAF